MKTFQRLKTELLSLAKEHDACEDGYKMGLNAENKAGLARAIMMNHRWVMIDEQLIDEAYLLEHFTMSELAEGGLYYQPRDIEKLSGFWKDSIQLDGYHTFDEAQESAPEGYRLPTMEEFCILVANTVYSFDDKTKEGVFTFKNGSVLRLPASGYRNGGNGVLYSQGALGLYWSISIISTHAYSLSFNSGNVTPADSNSRANGFALRCVKEVNNK